MTTYKLGFLGVVLCLFNQSFLYQVILYLFFVGRVKQQRNPTFMLGFVPQPNLKARLRGDADVGFCTSTPNYEFTTGILQTATGNEIPKA